MHFDLPMRPPGIEAFGMSRRIGDGTRWRCGRVSHGYLGITATAFSCRGWSRSYRGTARRC